MGCEQSRLGHRVGDQVVYDCDDSVVGRVTRIEDYGYRIWVEYSFWGKLRPSSPFNASWWKIVESVNPLEVL